MLTTFTSPAKNILLLWQSKLFAEQKNAQQRWIKIASLSTKRCQSWATYNLCQRFPTWGTSLHVPIGVHLPIRGVHLRLAIEEKHIFTYLWFPNIYTYISESYFQKPLYACFKIYLWLITTKYFVIRNFRGTCSSEEIPKGYVVIFRNAEGVHAHLSECWRGTWSEKGGEPLICAITDVHCCFSSNITSCCATCFTQIEMFLIKCYNSTASLGYPPTYNEAVIYLSTLENTLENRPSWKCKFFYGLALTRIESKASLYSKGCTACKQVY